MPPDASTFYRHRLPVRIMHWINVVCFFVMLMSGLGIFNAHPHLYWGQQSHFAAPLLSITSVAGPQGRPRGVTEVGGHHFDTDGVLGASRVDGDAAPLRLRVERQLGYKHAKYLMKIELVSRLDDIRGGHGGYWEDKGYEWYAGI